MDKMMHFRNNVKKTDLPENGMILCTGSDIVMDPDYWPLWVLRTVKGTVVESYTVFKTENSRPAEKMIGFSLQDIANWTTYVPSEVEESHIVLGIIENVNNTYPSTIIGVERSHIANKTKS